MNGLEYWRKRAEQDMDAVQDAAEARIRRIGRAARQAARDLTDEAERIIGTYAKRFNLTREQALAALDAPFDEDSRAYAYRRSRAEALRDAVDKQADKLARLMRSETKTQRAYTASESYKRAIGALRERGVGFSFAQPDADGLMRAIGTRWAGSSYSASIWGNRDALAERLQERITSAFLSGQSSRKLADDIRNEFGVSFRQAERLVRTETSYVSNQAAMLAYEDAQIEKYEFLSGVEDGRMCAKCAKLGGQVFAVKDAKVGVNMPPMHPWCRCTTVAAVDSALGDMTPEEAEAYRAAGYPEDAKGWLQKARGENLPDVLIPRSLSAIARNYEVMDLATGEKFRFVEGTHLQDVEVFAGKGSHTVFRKAQGYADRYGGRPENWQHVKGTGMLDCYGEYRKAIVHWIQCEGIDKIDFFIKEWLD